MKSRQSSNLRAPTFVAGLLLFLASPVRLAGEPTPAASRAFDSYDAAVESRLSQQHQSPTTFLAPETLAPPRAVRLRHGELIIEQLTPAAGTEVPGALLHDWRGTAFVPRATVADFERLMRAIDMYPQHFSPQVVQARALLENGDRLQIWMRVRQQHVLTVVMDSTYDVSFGRLDAQHGYSTSRSMRISEMDAPGTPHERALAPGEEHGFLWRLNTYWSYEEKDGGLYMQIECVSLTRSIPRGLGWAVRPFVESVPRESIEFTLRSTRDALRR